jgi:hypothetical protein
MEICGRKKKERNGREWREREKLEGALIVSRSAVSVSTIYHTQRRVGHATMMTAMLTTINNEVSRSCGKQKQDDGAIIGEGAETEPSGGQSA